MSMTTSYQWWHPAQQHSLSCDAVFIQQFFYSTNYTANYTSHHHTMGPVFMWIMWYYQTALSELPVVFVFQISWGLWLAGEFYWPIRPGRVHTPAECQPQPSVPEDLGEFSPVAIKTESLVLIISTKIQLGTTIYAVTDVVAERTHGSDVKVRLLFRCCWGCWQAQRSSFPRGAPAWTPRSLTTSSHWPAARSGQ